jgi:RNA polymerase sigma factor (sigma-70 family)
MVDPDTSIGGDQRQFPPTRHSLVEALRDVSAEERRRAFGRLVEAYWKPVYSYIRIRWRASNEDAKDWTQEFFARALAREFFAAFDPSRARFRTFLRTCLDRFLSNQRAAATRQKRGGGVEALPLDFDGAEHELAGIADETDPDAFFRREWVRALLGRSVERLRAVLTHAGKGAHCTLFERYDLHADPGTRPTYQVLADDLGLPVTQVTNYLAAARREFRRLVLDDLRSQAGSDAEFRADARDLLGIDP